MAMAGRAREAGVPLMNLVRLRGLPILEQLHVEERLLRTSSDNWCLINDGTSSPAIVMGLSGYLFISFILFFCSASESSQSSFINIPIPHVFSSNLFSSNTPDYFNNTCIWQVSVTF